MLDLNVKNVVNRWALHLTSLGHTNEFISKFIGRMVRNRGPLPNGCTCDNHGPRWFEFSLNGCCPACWAGALKADQMMFVNGVKPVTVKMVEESASWGFNKAKLRELRALRIHAAVLATM